MPISLKNIHKFIKKTHKNENDYFSLLILMSLFHQAYNFYNKIKFKCKEVFRPYRKALNPSAAP